MEIRIKLIANGWAVTFCRGSTHSIYYRASLKEICEKIMALTDHIVNEKYRTGEVVGEGA